MIKFVCGCGKHFKARDEMAKMRIVCPRCGSMVGIPSLEPTIAGGAAPMSPRERLRHNRDQPMTPAESAAEDLISAVLRGERPPNTRRVGMMTEKEARKRERSGRHLEKNWYECLNYPLRAWRLCLMLAVVLTVLSAGVSMIVPRILNEPTEDPWEMAVRHLGWVIVALVVVGLPCSFLDRVLVSAAGGEVDYILWSGNVVTTFLIAGARWLVCFLVGPALLAAVGWLYWVKCGDPSWLDLAILGEVGVVAMAYFVLALVAVADRGRWRDVNPLAVADLAYRLRWRGLAVVAAALLLLPVGLMVMAGVTEIHRGTLNGWLTLTAGWFAGVFLATFFARLLGVWCYLSRPAKVAVASAPSGG